MIISFANQFYFDPFNLSTMYFFLFVVVLIKLIVIFFMPMVSSSLLLTSKPTRVLHYSRPLSPQSHLQPSVSSVHLHAPTHGFIISKNTLFQFREFNPATSDDQASRSSIHISPLHSLYGALKTVDWISFSLFTDSFLCLLSLIPNL